MLSHTHTCIQQEGALSFWTGCIYCSITLDGLPSFVFNIPFFFLTAVEKWRCFMWYINSKYAMSLLFLFSFLSIPTLHCNKAFSVYFKNTMSSFVACPFGTYHPAWFCCMCCSCFSVTPVFVVWSEVLFPWQTCFCCVKCSCFLVIHVFALCVAAETDAGDDCEDAGPDAEAGRWRGRRPPCVKRWW